MKAKLGTRVDVGVHYVVHHFGPLLIHKEELAIVIPTPEADATGRVEPKGDRPDETTEKETPTTKPTATMGSPVNKHGLKLCTEKHCTDEWGPDGGYLLDGAITIEPGEQKPLRYVLLIVRKRKEDIVEDIA